MHYALCECVGFLLVRKMDGTGAMQRSKVVTSCNESVCVMAATGQPDY
jgi:hypothetical protein